MLSYLPVYLVSVVVFFIIDMVWLGFVAPGFYKAQIGHLMSDTVRWPVAIAFYLIFLIGLLLFVIVPAIDARSLTHALLYGALFGFFTYATYDLTNWATLKEWPMLVSIVDMAWGTVLAAVVSGMTYYVSVTYILP